MFLKRISILFVLLFIIYSCQKSVVGSGNVIKEDRVVAAFSKVDISGGMDIILTQGNELKLSVETDDNLMELITTEVKNNTLIIKTIKPFRKATSKKIYLTVNEIKNIDISGAVSLKNKGNLAVNKLKIDASGAVDIDLRLKADYLDLEMSGASEIVLEGKANRLEVDISGAGDLDAENFKTNNTIIEISGAGDAKVFAKKTLNISISGAGDIKYKGNPEVTKKVSGAGSIKKL